MVTDGLHQRLVLVDVTLRLLDGVAVVCDPLVPRVVGRIAVVE